MRWHLHHPGRRSSYAAASIADAPPIRTAIMARGRLCKIWVPFIFAYYPVILIVDVVFPEVKVLKLMSS